MPGVGLDAKMTAGNSTDGLNQRASAATSISSNGIIVGPSASLLIALACWAQSGSAPTVGTATWNGTSMTIGPNVSTAVGGAYSRAVIFVLINPAAGANTLTINWTGSADCYMSAISFTGTDTTTGIATADNTTATGTTTITVPSTSDGATVAAFAVDGATPTVNFTKIFAEAPLNPGGGANYTLGGSSNGHTFTGAGGSNQSLVGVHVLAGAGGGPSGQPTENRFADTEIGRDGVLFVPREIGRSGVYMADEHPDILAYRREEARKQREFLSKIRRAA